jgi:V8-like Glu-specific endopeptidase
MRKGALACLAAGLVACSSAPPGPNLPSFRDVSEAPAAIQTAARAVVRIGTAGEFGTGSFISPTGVLLTNNHILGVSLCPREGCYAQLTFMHQRGSPPQDPETVFVVPIAVDVGLDIAAVQAYPSPGAAPLSTPDYLTLDARAAASLQGTHIHVVGHPEGKLKKWSEGQVVDVDGSWIYSDAFALPGNSGSPLLDDNGHMVGILHRGPSAQDMETSDGLDEYLIGSASGPVVAALKAPLPPSLVSVTSPATDADVLANEVVYLNAHVADVPSPTASNTTSTVLSILGTACDAGLARQDYASPEDLGSALTPCTQAELWIDCRGDAPSTSTSPAFKVCPPDADAWSARYANVNAHWRALNGELSLDEVSFAPAYLALSVSAAQTVGSETLQAAVTAAKPILDFSIANYLAAFNIDSYRGEDLLAFVRGYASFPDYALFGDHLVNTALWLDTDGVMTGPDAVSFLHTLAGDGAIELGTKLLIEDVLYESGAD